LPVGGDSPINGPVDDQHADPPNAAATNRGRCARFAGGRGGPSSGSRGPDEESTAAPGRQIVGRPARLPIVADNPFPLQAGPSNRPRPAPPACASIPANIGSAQRVRDVVKRRQGPWFAPCASGGQRRQPGARPSGRNTAEPCPEAMVEERASTTPAILEGQRTSSSFKISVKGVPNVFPRGPPPTRGAGRGPCDYRCTSGSPRRAACAAARFKSSIGLGMLLWSGIGDTIRVSPVGRPGSRRSRSASDMLKSLGLRPSRAGQPDLPARPAPASSFQVDQDRRGAGAAARPHHHADVGLGHRLASVNGPGEGGGSPTSASPAAGNGTPHGLHQRPARPTG